MSESVGSLTAAEVVAKLDAIDATDPERAHSQADSILLLAVPPEVFNAYRRVEDRAEWWADA